MWRFPSGTLVLRHQADSMPSQSPWGLVEGHSILEGAAGSYTWHKVGQHTHTRTNCGRWSSQSPLTQKTRNKLRFTFGVCWRPCSRSAGFINSPRSYIGLLQLHSCEWRQRRFCLGDCLREGPSRAFEIFFVKFCKAIKPESLSIAT